MASNKQNLSDLLGSTGTPPEIRRGRGMRLSTEPAEADEVAIDAAQPDAPENAQSQDRTSAKTRQPSRVNRGYALREDYVKQLKRIAVEEDRKLYEVMEEALAQYLARRRDGNGEDDR
jgi:hypothetical protein